MTAVAKMECRRRWWLPSVGLVVWLILLLTLTLTQWRYALINVDGDACLHWRIGDWMIQHRAVLRHDVFSHTQSGTPVMSNEWLSEVVYAAAGNALGWNGIVLVAAILIATSFWLLYRLLTAEGTSVFLALILVLLVAWSSTLHWLARPHLWTYGFVVVYLWALRGFERGTVSARRLFLVVVPLMILWTNVHGGFVAGLILIAAFLIGTAITPSPERFIGMRTLAFLAVACVLASLLNPNGWKLHGFIFQSLRDSKLNNIVTEFQSPDFHGFWMRGFLVQLLIFGGLLLIARPKLNATDVLLIAGWGGATLYSARHAAILALVLTPVMAEHGTTWLTNAADTPVVRLLRRWSELFRRYQALADGRSLGIFCFALCFVLIGKSWTRDGQPTITTCILRDHFPAAALDYLRANPNSVHGEMFNYRRWGGYLELAAPSLRVFIDGRYGGKLIEDYKCVDTLGPQCMKVLKDHDVGWTILPQSHPLNHLLALSPRWKLVYQDEVATIYGQRNGSPDRP